MRYTIKDHRWFGPQRVSAQDIQQNTLFVGFCKQMGIKPSFNAALDCLYDKRRWAKTGRLVRNSVFMTLAEAA